MVGANIEPVEALILGSSEGGTAAGLTGGAGVDAADAVGAWGNFRKVTMITARMNKTARAHVSGLYCFG